MAQFIEPFPGLKPDENLSDRELARAIRQSIAAEHEAVHLYEAIADATDNASAKKVMQDVANEEKVHVGEFQALLETIQSNEKELVDDGRKEFANMSGEVSESVKIMLNGERYLLEEGDKIDIIPGGKSDKYMIEDIDYYARLNKMEKDAGINESKSDQVIAEAAVHRRYLLVSCSDEDDRCFSPSSANDNYILYFIERLCNSKRFNSRSYKVKIVHKIPKNCRKMSLETFLKELIPVPEKKK